MRITQGTFSFLPDFTDEQIAAQLRYALEHGWAMSVEYTDDPGIKVPSLTCWHTGAALMVPHRLPSTPHFAIVSSYTL